MASSFTLWIRRALSAPLGQALVVGIAYYALTRAGRALELPPAGIAIFWPASAVGLVAFLLVPRRNWAFIALAIASSNIIGNLHAGQPVSASFIFAAANVGEAAGGAWAFQVVTGREIDLTTPRKLWAFVAVATVLNSMLAAVVGAIGAIELAGATGGFLGTWRQWWIADANGILVLAPLVLAVARRNWKDPTRLPEMLTVSAFSAAAIALYFGLVANASSVVAVYLLLPPLLWGALRGSAFGAGLVFAPAVTMAVALTAHGYGPFVNEGRTLSASAWEVQLFFGVLGFSSLFVAIVPAANSRASRDRALLTQAQAISKSLQHSLLPESLPKVRGARVFGVYRAGVSTMDVGGDWYDAFALKSGRTALVVGDVVGRGLSASSAMGRLQSAVRVLAALEDGPARVLDRLEHFAATDEDARFATVVYGEFDPNDGTLVYSCAGHPPPIMVCEKNAQFLCEARGTPLAACREPGPHAEARLVITPGASVLFYTDGLVERRSESLSVGLDRLRDAAQVRLPAMASLDAFVDSMLEAEGHADDVCLLRLVRDVAAVGDFVFSFPAEPLHLADSRRALRGWLSALGIRRGEVDDIIAAVGEACANAVEHGYATHPAGRVDLTGHLDGSTLVISVSDSGAWKVATPNSGRGLGLPIMNGLMDTVEVSRSATGTTATITKTVDARFAPVGD